MQTQGEQLQAWSASLLPATPPRLVLPEGPSPSPDLKWPNWTPCRTVAGLQSCPCPHMDPGRRGLGNCMHFPLILACHQS